MTRFPSTQPASTQPAVASDATSHSDSASESNLASNPGSNLASHPASNLASHPDPTTPQRPNAQRPNASVAPKRLLFPLLSLLPLLAIPLALPAQRIQMGAQELRGLIGSYTGHGNWAITASYSGTENVTSLFTGGSDVGGSIGAVIGDRAYLVDSGSFALSMLDDQLPFENTDGGGSMQLDNALTMNF